ncbi:hypothetical protein GCM10028773_25210 [Spirosoma koreense]
MRANKPKGIHINGHGNSKSMVEKLGMSPWAFGQKHSMHLSKEANSDVLGQQGISTSKLW